jgi:hypothetical protein
MLSVLAGTVAELQGSFAAALKSAESKLLASERRATALAAAVQCYRVEFTALMSAIEELEALVEGIGHKNSKVGQYVRSLEMALEEAGAVSGQAAAELERLADASRSMEQEVES